MARPAYSRPFYAFQGLNNPGSTITVPAGRVYVVKQLTFYSSAILAPCRGFFRDLDSGATLFSAAVAPGTPGWFGFFGSLAFEAGASFRWEVSAALTDGADVYAGGYDLAAT